MDALLKKLNFKEGMKIRFWNVPEEFKSWEKEIEELGFTAGNETPDFLFGFVLNAEDLASTFKSMNSFIEGDELFWMCYPKKSSKKYKSDISRDAGWGPLAEEDFEGVRLISMNEDWSALRFRRIKNIKKMTRKFSLKDQLKK